MKESITIMGAVRKPDYGAEGHNWFFGELSRNFLDEILRMSEVCKSKEFNTVTRYSCVLDISSSVPKSACEVDLFKGDGCDEDLVTEDLDELVPDEDEDDSDTDEEAPRIDGLELVVGTDSIYWKWFSHYSDTECSTELITIEELKEAFKS